MEKQAVSAHGVKQHNVDTVVMRCFCFLLCA
jgi:hypothetical protein